MRLLQFLGLALLVPSFSYSLEFCAPDAQETAVVIIDMQEGFVDLKGKVKKPENKEKFEKLIAEQQALIAYAKSANLPIIFIQDESSGPTLESLIGATKNYPKATVLFKTSDGMLDDKSAYRDQVASHLEKNKIGKMIVAGINGNSCVYQSMYRALLGKCSIVAYSPGIANLNRSEIGYPIHYSENFGPTCKTCSFKEVQSLEHLKEVIPARASPTTEGPPSTSKGHGVSRGAQ